MRDVYKNDFCDVVRDGSRLAFASLIPKILEFSQQYKPQMVAYIANTTSKNHFLFSTFLMRDVYKDDFRNIAKDASSFAKANLMYATLKNLF